MLATKTTGPFEVTRLASTRTRVLVIAEGRGLLSGKTVAVDSTTLEANAAMKSIVRRDTGEGWREFVGRLAAEAGVEIEDEKDLRRFDKKRKDKKVSNAEWKSSGSRCR